jgi:hypothetical protein
MVSTAAVTLAKRYVWWQDPAETLENVPQLLRQIMALGTPADYATAVDLWGKRAFRHAFLKATPGALNDRSWYFWRRHFGLPEEPPPARSFDASTT